MQKGMQTVQHFSIRKCGMGAASVLLGMFLVTGSALAEEVSTVPEVTTQLETQESSWDMASLERAIAKAIAESLKNTKVDQPRKGIVDAASSEITEQKVEKAVVTEPKVTVPEAKKETPQVVAPKKEAVPQKVVESVVEVPKMKKSNALPTLSFAHLGDDYPAYLKNAAPDSLIDPWRLWNRECVSFVAHRLSSVNGFTIPGAYGNADQWGTRARREGYVVDNKPAVGSVAWWRSCHVAWVSEVSGDYVTIEEYNYDYTHRYHKRTIPISKVDGFIHFKDLSASTVVKTPSVSHVTPVSHSSLAKSGTYQFTKTSIIRAEAKLSSPELAHYDAGDSVHYDKLVEADGFRWLSYLSYKGNRRYIAIEALKHQKSPVNKVTQTPQPTSPTVKITLPASGVYTFQNSSPVKAEAKSASPTLATYDKGEKVNYDKVLIAEGKQWISYLSYSGARRYIQVD